MWLLCRLSAAGVAAFFISSAYAQEIQNSAPADTPVLIEIDDSEKLVPRLNVTVAELQDLNIYGINGARIADVDEVLGNVKGQILAVTMDVGGFLGIGERKVVVPLDEIQLDGLRLTLPLSKEEISALPEWG